MAGAYYNEIEPFAAGWLRKLIKAGHIADGEVDERDIRDIAPNELSGFTQCHFFAGIGVWSFALRNAGWPDDRPVWTGSCPCQPFSQAGRRKGDADERHLWPHFFHLIQQCTPDAVFGEQVASKDGLAWLDTVQSDMEATGYAFGATGMCACGVGAPHIRNRLWFLGVRLCDAGGERLQRHPGNGDTDPGRTIEAGSASEVSSPDGLANSDRIRRGPRSGLYQRPETGSWGNELGISSGQDGLEDSERHGWRTGRYDNSQDDRWIIDTAGNISGPGPTNGFWKDADWIGCRDQRWRPVEPGLEPLVNGATNRVGRLRGYGNAINAEAARVWIEAASEVML
ncbi:MAG: DNA cytosine methyltransferase [Phycisphaerales bacterium]|nr:DNA cytosine methyltransferase [Phycisphaerales bacterium]